MKCRVETRNLRRIRKPLAELLQKQRFFREMLRIEWREAPQFRKQFIVHLLRFKVAGPTMHYAVAHNSDAIKLNIVREPAHELLDGYRVIHRRNRTFHVNR